MTDYALRVRDIGKEYKIGQRQEKYQTLRDVITDSVSAPFRRARQLMRGEAYGAANLTESIWALKDISFDVKHGEVVGIIGHNGAGKSTLLKVLSQITEPTTGEIRLYGRVGALLEVGTGFHEELTGRENVYLNGAILGMGREEIDRKFDEIVDFAGVETFIDTPVKHYSSGMKLRLGFAVAAHLEPEILVVDEVLAVGDAAFQKKCLGKMSDVADSGRTVLFVSHNMAAVSSLCTRGILLNSGEIMVDDDTANTIATYTEQNNLIATTSLRNRSDRTGNGKFRFTDIQFKDRSTNNYVVQSGHDVDVVLTYEISDGNPIENINAAIVFYDLFGNIAFTCSSRFLSETYTLYPDGQLICKIDNFPLAPGRYTVKLWGAIGTQTVDSIENAVVCDVTPGDFFGSGNLPTVSKHGYILVHHSWQTIASQAKVEILLDEREITNE